MAKFPKTLYVKQERIDGENWFTANTVAENLVEWDKIKIATYQLVEVRSGVAVVEFKKESSGG